MLCLIHDKNFLIWIFFDFLQFFVKIMLSNRRM